MNFKQFFIRFLMLCFAVGLAVASAFGIAQSSEAIAGNETARVLLAEMLKLALASLTIAFSAFLSGAGWLAFERFVKFVTPDSFEMPLLTLLRWLKEQYLATRMNRYETFERTSTAKLKGVVLAELNKGIEPQEVAESALPKALHILKTDKREKAQSYIRGIVKELELSQ